MVSAHSDFLLGRAAAERRLAEAAALDNVRDGHLRAAAAWDRLAARAVSSDKFRAEEVRRKAEAADNEPPKMSSVAANDPPEMSTAAE